MNKLDKEHIHLLIDEPIYVLADHGDHPSEASVNEAQPKYSGENLKGICIFTGSASEKDLVFLFKGLNALNISEKDVAIFDTDYDALKQYPAHSRRLRFSEHVKLESAFTVNQSDNNTILNSIPLQEIRNSQDFKRQFWEALKAMFK